MDKSAYAVAFLTRGVGAYTYTYAGPTGLARGQLCAASFRDKLETGVIIDTDEDYRADKAPLPLLPLADGDYPDWGGLLCDLAELTGSTPREVAGHLLFAPPARGLHLVLELVDPEVLPAKLRAGLAALAGRLTPVKRQELMQLCPWAALVAACAAGAVELRPEIAGASIAARPHTKLAKHYAIDDQTAQLLGIKQRGAAVLPGSFLACLDDDLDFPWPAVRQAELQPDAETGAPAASELHWEAFPIDKDWAICRRWPEIAAQGLHRSLAGWRELRGPGGLAADLLAGALAGRNVLVLAPMAWMLERLWPEFTPWAGRVHRYRSDAGPSAAAVVLRALKTPGRIVCGLESSWKLAAYGAFDRVVVLDPTHPHYEPEGDPWLDARYALLIALAGRKRRLDVVEIGMSFLDGRARLKHVELLAPHEPSAAPAGQGRMVDFNPMPLKLRQPDRRRLVYFNRLGQSRGMRCIECGAAVRCPQCSGLHLYFSATQKKYRCPNCGLAEADIRCHICGTASLAAEYPGIEAIDRRSGDALVHGSGGGKGPHAEYSSVMGTQRLLEPVAEFWPQEVVYIHLDTRGGALDNWPRALDMAARLTALYANPQLEHTYIVSSRLVEQLGGSLTAQQAQSAFAQELTLRRLAQLPPYGKLCLLRLRGADAKSVIRAGKELQAALDTAGGEAGAWLSKPYARRSEVHATGYAVDLQIEQTALQQLRAKLRRQRISLSVNTIWGPWL